MVRFSTLMKSFFRQFKKWLLNYIVLNPVRIITKRATENSSTRVRSQNRINLHQQKINCYCNVNGQIMWLVSVNQHYHVVDFSPTPEGHGWMFVNGKLGSHWMSQKPALGSILEFIACSCKNSLCQEKYVHIWQMDLNVLTSAIGVHAQTLYKTRMMNTKLTYSAVIQMTS